MRSSKCGDQIRLVTFARSSLLSRKGKYTKMIPEIGVMVGGYIVTRMVAMLGSGANVVAQIFAVITILVALVVCWDLLLRGLPELTEQLPQRSP